MSRRPISRDADAELMSEFRSDVRPDPRPSLRPDDSRSRAEARTRELLQHGALDADTEDRLYVDLATVPDGWTYEWKRKEVYGKADPAYDVKLARSGWQTVEASRHPELMPKGWTGATIERDGMVLMERPEAITEMVRDRDHRNAAQPIRDMEAKLSGTPQGQFERNVKGQSLAKVRTGKFEPIPIPEK